MFKKFKEPQKLKSFCPEKVEALNSSLRTRQNIRFHQAEKLQQLKLHPDYYGFMSVDIGLIDFYNNFILMDNYNYRLLCKLCLKYNNILKVKTNEQGRFFFKIYNYYYCFNFFKPNTVFKLQKLSDDKFIILCDNQINTNLILIDKNKIIIINGETFYDYYVNDFDFVEHYKII